MIKPLRASTLAIALGLTLVVAVAAIADRRPERLPDVLDTPAVVSKQALNGSFGSVARHGSRLIGVGLGGRVAVSVDGGGNWKQVPSPVSADLVSVKFIDDKTVWAVGHDAVALRSPDAGESWERVLDGRSVLKLLETFYGERAAKGDAAAKEMLDEVARSAAQSATPGVLPEPILDVWFGEGGEGWLVGAFGLILRTADGGRTWEPWIERADNDKRFHLYGVTGHAGQVWAVGEQGLVMRLDRAQQRFVQVPTPYNGTWFGMHVTPELLLAYGLRGNAFASRDAGANWQQVETGTDAHIVATVNAGNDRLLLVSQAGQVMTWNGSDPKAQALTVPYSGEVLGAVNAGGRGLALAQLNGIRLVEVAGQSLQ